MLALTAFIKWLNDKVKYNYIMIIYIIIMITMFAIFYPVTSGMTVSERYIESIEWLKTWYF